MEPALTSKRYVRLVWRAFSTRVRLLSAFILYSRRISFGLGRDLHINFVLHSVMLGVANLWLIYILKPMLWVSMFEVRAEV
jgi:hypothetical protein